MDEQKDKEKTFTAGWWSYSIFQHGLMRSCWQAKLWPVGQAIGVYHETNCFLLSVVLSCIAKTYHHKSKKGHMLCKRLGDLHVIKKKSLFLDLGKSRKTCQSAGLWGAPLISQKCFEAADQRTDRGPCGEVNVAVRMSFCVPLCSHPPL